MKYIMSTNNGVYPTRIVLGTYVRLLTFDDFSKFTSSDFILSVEHELTA